MKNRLKKYGWILLGMHLLLIALFFGFVYLKDPAITGLIIYEETQATKNWTFEGSADYVYNSSLISLQNGNAKLVSTTSYSYWNTTTETGYQIVSALHNPKDQTEKVESIDNKKFKPDEGKLFEVVFSENLASGDVISLYLEKDDDNASIYLCGKGSVCNNGVYGSSYYNGSEGFYNITLSNLESPAKIFSVTASKKIEFNWISSTKGSIAKAFYDPDSKFSKVQANDNEYAEIDKNKIFNIVFDSMASNGNIISMYLKDGSPTEIYLCDYNELCSSPGYGLANFNGSKDFYNITLSNLNQAKNSFNLNANKDIKIDHIKEVNRVVESHETPNISYPLSAAIETNDFSINNLFSFLDFGKNDLLNGQTSIYYYSTDSGDSWNPVPSSNNLSELPISGGKIRVRTELLSNSAETPVIYDFAVSYITKICNENWNLNYGACLSDGTKLKHYIDANDCGTRNNLPADNGSYTGCYYDNKAPNATKFIINPRYGVPGILVNISINITDESDIFASAEIKDSENNIIKDLRLEQDPAGLFSSTFDTENLSIGMYTLNILANDSKNNKKEHENAGLIALMPHAKSSFTNNSINIRQNEKVYIDARNESNALIEFQTDSDIFDASFSVAHYTSNAKNSSPELNELGRYIDIIADGDTSQNLTSATIRIYYTDEDVANKNLDESSLKIHYFNETGNKWQILVSTVNTTGNYVEITIDHLSTFGIFGETIVQSSGSSSGSGGGGGGGRRVIPKTEQKIEVIEEKTEAQKVDSQQIYAIEEQEVCSHKIAVSLPDQISFIDSDREKGIVRNIGNCLIGLINISLDERLNEIISLENELVRNIDVNQSAEFVLAKKLQSSRESISLMQGFNIKIPEKTVRTLDGILAFDTLSDSGVEIAERINIKVEVEKDSVFVNILNYKTFAIIASSLALFALIGGYILYRKKKRKDETYINEN